MFKSLLVVVLVALCAACTPDPKITLNKKIELSNGLHYTYSCEEDIFCDGDKFVAERSIGEETQYFCDLGGKFYIIKSQYRTGSVSILQEGIKCKYIVERTRQLDFIDGNERIEKEILSTQ